MLQRPRLKAHYLVDVLDDSKVFLLAEGNHFLFDSPAVAAVLPHLDGTSAVADIVVAVADRVPMTQAFTAIASLAAGGHLAEGRPDLPDSELAFWDLQGIDPALVSHRYGAAPTPLLVLGGIDPQPVIDLLSAGQLPTRLTATVADLDPADGPVVVLTDDYLDPSLEAINRAFLAGETRWVLGKPAGRQLWLGPLFTPNDTGCWACLQHRLAANRQVERYLAGRRTGPAPRHRTAAVHPAPMQVFAGLLASELLRVGLTGRAARLDGRMLTVDAKELTLQEHSLVRRPQCPACGDPTLISRRNPKVVMTSRIATHTTDGGHRIEPPIRTYQRLERQISPILGAVTMVSAHQDSDNGLTYSFTAGHNFAMVNDNIDLLKRNLRGQSGGKGRTETQAKVSAVCEAIERYCAVWTGDEPVTRAPYDRLDPTVAVHPNRLLLFSQAQFDGRDAWNTDPAHRLHLVPERFDEHRPIDWSSAWSLTEETERLVPSGIAWYGHPDLAQHFYCVGDSNGSASGNTLEEAVLQGFCELVERDAVALWWYNRIPRAGFDLDSLGDPYTTRLTEFYRQADRELWVLDLTSDLGIPVFAAVSRRIHQVEDVMVGFGAHPDARLAVLRALTEVNQFLPFVDRRDADGNTVYRIDDVDTLAWCRGVQVRDEPWLLPAPGRRVTPADFRPLDGADLADHVAYCVQQARSAGVEVIALDQSRPDIDLSVVKVLAPGLRHFWRRLGPGRLYDVPVSMGWRAAPAVESDLNPRNVFF